MYNKKEDFMTRNCYKIFFLRKITEKKKIRKHKKTCNAFKMRIWKKSKTGDA